MFILGATSFYGLTVVTTFIAQSQLDIKFRNKFYEEKYIETEKPRRMGFKETASNTIKFLLPIYNVVSSVYHLKRFDKYYDKIKDELLIKGYLEKIEIKEDVNESKEEVVFEKTEEPINTYIWGNDIEEEIEYVKSETFGLQNQKKLVKKIR